MKAEGVLMRIRFVVPAIALTAVTALSLTLWAQTPAPARTPPAQARSGSGRAADLAGDWTPDLARGGFGQSLSLTDIGGRKRGQEDDIPYQPWAREKTMAQKPSTGANSQFAETTDPQVLYCEPPGVPHIYLWPIKTKFVATPEAVYILHELGPYFRIVWLNSKHPDDPDPQWWGHSIGWYENGNTLVVDSVGFNDKTWLDQMGHPHTEKLHLIERYKRVDANTLELDMTVDDPGAYTKPWNAHRNFTVSKTGFMRYQQICSVRENQQFFDTLGKPAIQTPPGK
jgi:hypothetical protein